MPSVGRHSVATRSSSLKPASCSPRCSIPRVNLFAGMEGSRIPIVVSHGEGGAVFDNAADQEKCLSALRYIDNKGEPTEVYPYDPNVQSAA